MFIRTQPTTETRSDLEKLRQGVATLLQEFFTKAQDRDELVLCYFWAENWIRGEIENQMALAKYNLMAEIEGRTKKDEEA